MSGATTTPSPPTPSRSSTQCVSCASSAPPAAIAATARWPGRRTWRTPCGTSTTRLRWRCEHATRCCAGWSPTCLVAASRCGCGCGCSARKPWTSLRRLRHTQCCRLRRAPTSGSACGTSLRRIGCATGAPAVAGTSCRTAGLPSARGGANASPRRTRTRGSVIGWELGTVRCSRCERGVTPNPDAVTRGSLTRIRTVRDGTCHNFT
mmetsp:Transcript_8402/g.26300  ORF Transcript_8402/g.26300 Transcript_8402/m.26300 type:complete len:207 (+) Transcript_8402:239-859(+)